MKFKLLTAGLVSAAMISPVLAGEQKANAVNDHGGVTANQKADIGTDRSGITTQQKANVGTDGTITGAATSAATAVKDTAITAKIKAKLAAEKLSSLAKVSVDTDQDGTVVLSGTADDQAAAAKAETIARSTDGVKQVQNRITVKKTS